jgi:Fungal Zn(2)-Cys(6) binuclear cluster domain
MPSKIDAGPSLMACLACRSKHLKCDGKTPLCTRCAASGVECVFVQSRRGYNGSRKRQTDQPTTATPEGSEDAAFANIQHDSLSSAEQQFPIGESQISCSDDTMSIPRVEYDSLGNDYLIDVYYLYIHPAHPFIIPRKMYLQDRSIIPDFLKKVMRFIASHFSSEDSDTHRQRASIIFDAGILQDGFRVQGLILFTLASYARFERDQGNKALTEAIDLALRIGLDSDTFANGQHHVLQESWRRTWWELYTITGLISLITSSHVRLSQPPHMALPGHCGDYESCQPIQPKTAEQMQERCFMESEFQWSSFAYKIEAMRILGSVLEIENDSIVPRRSKFDAANASISTFLLSLPPDKRRGVERDGEMDEVMSCALMIINLASICLHLPRSGLAGIRSFRTVCGNDRARIVADDCTAHASTALKSSNALSNLIMSRSSLKTLTPCFSCAIAFGATVQLAAYLLEQDPSGAQYLKEHIQLALSALNVIGENWPIARVVRGQLAQFAREILNRPTTSIQAMFLEQLPAQTNLDSALGNEQWLQDFINEDRIVSMDGFFSSVI